MAMRIADPRPPGLQLTVAAGRQTAPAGPRLPVPVCASILESMKAMLLWTALFCSIALLGGSPVAAQVSDGGLPVGLQRVLTGQIPVAVLPAPDVAAYTAEDAARNHRPLRYGALVDVRLGLEDGLWLDMPDGSRVWRLRLLSPGAKSLAVEFARFALPAGARFFVYHEDRAEILGAYTASNTHSDGGFVFEPYPGQELVLELDLPAGAGRAAIETSSVVHDYRDVFGLMGGTVELEPGVQSLGPCLIDVNCSQGNQWGLQKRATLRTLSSGVLCSGALLNNTNNDGTPYVLTADHCGQVASTVFLFRYQTSGCGGGTAPTNFSTSGCTVLTTSSTYDSRLLRLDAPVPASHEPYMAGWTRSTANATFAFTMGHPNGGPKKIAIDGNGTVLEGLNWRTTWSQGLVEGGSSGGPLFDESGRVKGPVCCGDSVICSAQSIWFGRFDGFWGSNGLAQWLDPLGSNPTTLDGFDPYPPCVLPTNVCTTTPNSVGQGAVMLWGGSTVRSQNNFFIAATGLPPGAANIFFYGPTQTSVPFGNGVRCVSGSMVRLAVSNASVVGDAVMQVNLVGSPIDAGEVWFFQNWYRNPAAGGAGFNLSDALRTPFCF